VHEWAAAARRNERILLIPLVPRSRVPGEESSRRKRNFAIAMPKLVDLVGRSVDQAAVGIVEAGAPALT